MPNPVEKDVLAVPSGEFRRDWPTLTGYRQCADEVLRWLLSRPDRLLYLPWRDQRDVWEQDEHYKQLVAYVAIRRAGRWLAYRRVKGEARLEKYRSLGIGGHLEYRDCYHAGGLATAPLAGAIRELDEEVIIQPYGPVPTLIGILADQANPVGRCHLGFVFLLDLPAGTDVIPRDPELDLIGWEERETLARERPALEPWSRLLLDALLADRRALEPGRVRELEERR